MTHYGERGYLELVKEVLDYGERREDRTGVGVLSSFYTEPLVFNLGGVLGFPLLTTKKMPWKSIRAETLWFAQGRFDLESLRADGCSWWDDWEREDGTLGRIYGAQLRHWQRPDGTEYDQLAAVIDEIKTNPNSRRLVMTNWNAGELDDMALPPCHGALIQFYVDERGRLELKVNIRSSDLFLGLPTNIASYALLDYMVAEVVGLRPGALTVILGDAHIYLNHIDAVSEQLTRTPKRQPKLELVHRDNIDDFTMDDFILTDYFPKTAIKAPIAV